MNQRRSRLSPVVLDGAWYAASCLAAAAAVPFLERWFRTSHASPPAAEIAPVWIGCFGLLWASLSLGGCYRVPRRWSRVRILRALAVSCAATATIYLTLTIPFAALASARKTILATLFASLWGLWYWRLVFPQLYGRLDRKRRVLLVGAHTFSVRALQRFARERSDELEIVGAIDDFKQGPYFENLGVEYLGGRKNLATVLRTRAVDAVIVLMDASRYSRAIVGLLDAFPTVREVFVRAQIPLSVAQDIDLLFAQEVPLLKVYSSSGAKWRLSRVCGALDRAAAAVGLILASPVFLVASILIKLDSRGPVFYRQRRLGLGERPFDIWKFRSMVVDAEAGCGAVLAERNDRRVTRVGRVLRALRIDEIPQLLNVLRGEMSLIGPRPERPEFQNAYRELIPWYPLRSLCKPGITGLAQVNGDYHTSAQRKLLYDVSYLANMSFWNDVRILAATVVTVLTRKGH
jgi:exopolysaccharide biosynthesis polyprenyl glycosylphosphotransferase